MNAKLLFLHALSPLHAGTGQGVGAIDLPIAREKGTDIPIVPGSSVKGVLRDACDVSKRTRIFGPDTANAAAHAGAIQISDLRMVALPVRSLAGVFAWVTSPLLLQRLSRDAQMAGHESLPSTPWISDTAGCCVASQSALRLSSGDVVLEDVKLTPTDENADGWAEWLARAVFEDDWQEAFKARLCIVHDDVMSFLLQTGTEVTARIRLQDEKKTVAKGALWYEEALPTESLLVGLVVAAPVQVNNSVVQPEEVFETVAQLVQRPLQIGGNATVGRGICCLRMVEVNNANA